LGLKIDVALWTFHFGEDTGIICIIATLRSSYELSLANIFIPKLRLGLDKIAHELDARRVL
jgi:hypothetical protein